jgi:hypothetical protein
MPVGTQYLPKGERVIASVKAAERSYPAAWDVIRQGVCASSDNLLNLIVCMV